MQQKKNHINIPAALLLTCVFALITGCHWQKREPQKKARLANATSPYLREHASNPVNWYEWGDEPLALAKKENKPLLISIGYAACHWCHVMENECYMDTGVARIMNEQFICIKVDREERPDIDKFYSNALQLLSGSSGWPLHAFALPDGKPFFAGTYYPKRKFMQLLLDVSSAFKQKQKLVVTQANALANGIANNNLIQTPGPEISGILPGKFYHDIADSLAGKLDPVGGGLKGAPKFPHSSLAEFLLEQYYLTGNKRALILAETHLKKMALGGIYDQLEGGFARYSSDSTWNKPHFEKMLYDNGLLISTYSHAYQLTKDPFYRQITEATIEFVQQNLAAPDGGYYSSLNADTEAGEGAYYTWTEKEFRQLTGNNDQVAAYYHITGSGNLGEQMNVLFANSGPTAYASTAKIEPALFSQVLNRAKQQLLEQRRKRNRPAADTKIICAWNGILLKGFADAYAATSNPAYLLAATRSARFMEKKLLLPGGQLQRAYTPGGKGIGGFLDDYAWTAAAYERLYEVSLDDHWLILSKQLTDHIISKFYDQTSGLFFYSPAAVPGSGMQHIMIDDGDMPSANAVMARQLRTIGAIFADSSYQQLYSKMILGVSEKLRSLPVFYMEWCRLFGMEQAKRFEIAVMGKDAAETCKKLHLNYLPSSVILGSAARNDQFPLLKDKWTEDRTLIYVCTENRCRRPEEDVSKALAQLQQ